MLMSSFKQRIRFCTSPDGVRIAYGTTGTGPAIVKAPTGSLIWNSTGTARYGAAGLPSLHSFDNAPHFVTLLSPDEHIAG